RASASPCGPRAEGPQANGVDIEPYEPSRGRLPVHLSQSFLRKDSGGLGTASVLARDGPVAVASQGRRPPPLSMNRTGEVRGGEDAVGRRGCQTGRNLVRAIVWGIEG